MDVGSSRTAANVVGTVQGSLKSLVIDLAVLLEGHSTVSHHLALAFLADLAHSAPLCDYTSRDYNTQTTSQKSFALAPKCCCVRLYGSSAWLKLLEKLLNALPLVTDMKMCLS